MRRRRGPSAALRLGGYAATQLRHSDRGASGWRGGRERARVGRLGPERVVLTAVHARGASRPRGDVHETAFAAAVEALSRRRLCRARTPQRRFEFRRTQGVRGPRGRGRHGTTERGGGRTTTQTLSANRPIAPFAASGKEKRETKATPRPPSVLHGLAYTCIWARSARTRPWPPAARTRPWPRATRAAA